jgi:hypothetical protein
MNAAQAIAQAYLDTWNETDASRRSARLAAHWTPQAHYADPMMRADSSEQIGGLIAAVHDRFPGFTFTLKGTPDGHGEFVRLAWTLGPKGVEAPIEGSDVLEVEGQKIRRVVGFIDKAP